MRLAIYLAVATAAFLSGCATTLSPQDSALLSKPVICSSAQCDIFWQRAQIYINRNSELKIQMANDTVIQTFTGPKNSVDPEYSLSRMSIGDGLQQIDVNVQCPNIYGMCYPSSAKVLKLNLIKYMKTGSN